MKTLSDKGFARPYRQEGQTIRALTHGVWFSIARVDCKKFTAQGREDQAAFIVHACNAHDELLAALEMANKAMSEESGYWQSTTALTIRAAIAKATGGHP